MGDPDEWDNESDQLDAADTLDTRNVADPLDEGISPPERPWIGDGWGVTARTAAIRSAASPRCERVSTTRQAPSPRTSPQLRSSSAWRRTRTPSATSCHPVLTSRSASAARDGRPRRPRRTRRVPR